MFTLVNKTDFPELKTTARLFRHDCGMQVLSLEADDPENLFSLCFSTIPTDDTGVPHIIEHSVLEGSRAFPVKDPFVCMLKSSVATFINAMTYPDRTIYPCTSCCRKDYFNLFEVYWDAVFHPRLDRETFAQEGWHYEFKGSGKGRKLIRNGIVLNEMSGYYSDPGTILGRAIEQSLFTGTPMNYDSGGDPAAIPRLSYAKFASFHRLHYSPAVTKVVLYGNIPTADKLAFIEAHLEKDLLELGGAEKVRRRAEEAAAAPSVPVASKPARGPQVVRRSFIPDQESRDGKAIFALAWALDMDRDPELDLAFQLLETVLFGNHGAPMRQAIQNSNLCSSIMVSGYDNETRYTSFEVAMRGVRQEDFDKLEALVMDTLKRLAEEGIPQECLEAALSELLLSTRSVGTKFVIDLLDDVCASWMYGDDPYAFLRQYGAPSALKEKLRTNPGYLEGIIRKWLLENPARVRVELLPDSTRQKREEKVNEARLAALLGKWTPDKRRRCAALQKRLAKRALTPDSPAALATLPRLTPADLDARVPQMPYTDGTLSNGTPLRCGTLFANGIGRLSLIVDASTLPADLIPWLGLFCALFRRMGNAQYAYDRLAAKCASLGVSYALLPGGSISPWNKGEMHSTLALNYVALDDNFEAGLSLLKEQLATIDFTDVRCLSECLREFASSAAAALNGRDGALHLATARAGAGVLAGGYLAELQGGLAAYRLTRSFAKADEARLAELAVRMEAIAKWLAKAPLAGAGFVGSDAALAAIDDFTTSKATGALRAATDCTAALAGLEGVSPSGRHEFGVIPTQVSTCVRVLAGPHRSDSDYAASLVGFSMLSRGYMWDEIRAKGGAYGAGMGYDSASCAVKLLSTDDPNPQNTRRAFEQVRAFVEGRDFTADEIGKAILTCAGKYFKPFRPVGFASLCAGALLNGIGNEECQKDYEALLSVTPVQVKEALLKHLDMEHVPYNDFCLGPSPVRGDTPVEIG